MSMKKIFIIMLFPNNGPIVCRCLFELTMDHQTCLNFDVIGTKFRFSREFFSRYSSSVFHSILSNDDNSDLPVGITKISSNNFYIERSPDVFQIVIKYCISGKLHLSKHVCTKEILDEFRFWKIKLESCCEHCVDDQEIEKEIAINNKCEQKEKKEMLQSKFAGYRTSLWNCLEHPHSSLSALIFNVVSIMFILITILNIILSSLPELQFCPVLVYEEHIQINHKDHAQSHTKGATTLTADIDHRNETEDIHAALNVVEDDFQWTDCTGTMVFHMIDMTCIAWFTLEVVLRFVSCPTLQNFFTKPLNIIDILAVLPFYIELILWATGHIQQHMDKARVALMFLRVLRIVRIFRVVKLARYSMSLQTLGKTLHSAKQEFTMLLMFISFAMFVFSNFLYQFEKDEPDSSYSSIPASFWWCIVTLTTVGYGDVYPKTVAGKIVGGCTCVCGVLIVGFPIAILVEKFMTVYKKSVKETMLKKHAEKKS